MMDLRTISVDRVTLDAPRGRGNTYQLRYGAEKVLKFQTPVWKLRYTEHRSFQRVAAEHPWFDELVCHLTHRLGQMAGLDPADAMLPRTIPLATDCVSFDQDGTFLDESPLHAGCDYAAALLVGVRGIWVGEGGRYGLQWDVLQVRVVETLYVPQPRLFIDGVERRQPMFVADP
jgi:hypothetical protein